MANKRKFKDKVTISHTMENEHKTQIETEYGNRTDFINAAIKEKLEKLKGGK